MWIYVMALYTFYVTTHAIISMIKYRKYNSPVMSATKIISLSAVLVSMLSLETAMFSQFGGDTSPEFKRFMIAVTGAGVSLIVVSMSVYMIVRATREKPVSPVVGITAQYNALPVWKTAHNTFPHAPSAPDGFRSPLPVRVPALQSGLQW